MDRPHTEEGERLIGASRCSSEVGLQNVADRDATQALNDELLLNILRRQPTAPYPCSLVCKRWLALHGSLRRSIRVQEWIFLQSGRLKQRFPRLSDVDLTRACLLARRNSPSILLTHRGLTIPLSPRVASMFPLGKLLQEHQLSPTALDAGLQALAEGYPSLQRLCVVDVGAGTRASTKTPEEGPGNDAVVNSGKENSKEETQEAQIAESMRGDAPLPKVDGHQHAVELPVKGLVAIANRCSMLQELRLHQCTDETLRVISVCQNLQILSLVGSFCENHMGTFTDVGLTILAHRCRRLVKLELAACEASYHGIAAIGHCCIMLEALTLSTDGFQEGWLAALSLCTCLKTLSLESSKKIDSNPGPLEYLGSCPALEQLQLRQCDLRNKPGFGALLSVCRNVRELELRDCWGLEDEIFGLANKCRKIRLLSLEGCTLLTTMGLEAAILPLKELQNLRVVCCDNIKDSEISPALATCFASLKEFKWRPDTKSMLAISLAGTGVGQVGSKFFKKK